MSKRRKARARKRTAGSRVREFLEDSAAPVMSSVVDAARRGESVGGAWLRAMMSQAFGFTAKEAFEWVSAEKGRSVVLGWEGDSVSLKFLESDGKEAAR